MGLGTSFKVIFGGFLAIMVIAVGLVLQDHADAFSLGTGAQISVVFTPEPSLTPTPPIWTLQSKIAEAKALLANTTLKVGTGDITYVEERISPTSVSRKTLKEPEKELALASLNTQTGDISIIKITKRGGELIAPAGWDISIAPRASGIRWNSWNTAFHVGTPANQVIVANVYPNETNKRVAVKKNGKTSYTIQQSIKHVFYAPYSPDLHQAELVNAGEKYISDTVARALAELKASNTGSISVAGSTVYDAWQNKASFFGRIPMLEQTDLTEFILDPQKTTERIYTIIGANGDGAFANTCNSSSACGWVQFTPGTYNMLVKTYPAAGLIKDFLAGAANHENSIKAAVLLYDYNLKGLIKTNGASVVHDPKLEEYLAASYNGSPSRAYRSLAASILHSFEDWIGALTSKQGGLANETRGYLVKLRYLQDHAS